MTAFRPLPSRAFPRLVTVLGLLAICTGATTSRSCSFRDSNRGGGDDQPDFVTRLELQDANGQATNTFERGQLVQMILTVRNRRDTAVTLNFATTRTFDFVVVRENTDDVVWQMSDDEGPPSNIPTTLDFAPNGTQSFSTTWNQIASKGDRDQVRAGTYEARGVLIFDGFDANPLRPDELGSTLERFTIN